MKGIELDFLQEFSFQICLSRGATFPDFRERRWSNISFFCSAVRFPGTKRGAVGAKVVDVADKVGCFRPKTVGFSAKVPAFFLSLGRKGTPPAPFGAKSPRSKGEVGACGDAFAHGGASASLYIRRAVRFSARKLCVSAEKP